ncbi:ABC transporter permease [Actinomadura vinacea]|uniref:ABC transporter permease n=1 Tax=Actinomadura vinacea TaxID=115336 RepID=A0ABN3KBF1_9ACTN
MAAGTTERTGGRVALGLLLPGVLALVATYGLPLVWVLRMSLNEGRSGGAIQQTVTADSFAKVLGDGFYWKVIGSTVQLGVLVTVCAVVLSYPIALFLSQTTSRWRGVLVALAVAPLLTSSVARTYGWMVILGDQGVVNGTLRDLGLISGSVPLANNLTGVVIALTEIFMPYAVLAMLSGFGRLSGELEHAAASLGANRWRVFWRVTLPLSLPGVLTAALLVFVLAISAYVTPALIGGGRVFVLATEIYDEATVQLNWPVAAALSVLLLVLFSTIVLVYQRANRALEAQSGRPS